MKKNYLSFSKPVIKRFYNDHQDEIPLDEIEELLSIAETVQ